MQATSISNDASKYWQNSAVSESYSHSRPQYPLQICELIFSSTRTKSPTATAVDIGCGPGCCTLQLAHFFDKVIGVDPSHEQLQYAMQHAKIEYKCASAEDTQLPDHCADAVIVAQVCYYIFFFVHG